eukprot:9684912-Karenia_brevis.AAC.1
MGAASKRAKGDDSEDDPTQGFSLATSSANGLTLEQIAAVAPGSLLDSGLREIARAMCQRGGGSLEEQDVLAQRVESYLKCIVHGKHPVQSMNARDAREMDLVAKCIDALCQGELAHVGDILMQRFKSLELRQELGDFHTAQNLEVHHTSSGLASTNEVRLATKVASDLDRTRWMQQRLKHP